MDTLQVALFEALLYLFVTLCVSSDRQVHADNRYKTCDESEVMLHSGISLMLKKGHRVLKTDLG